MLCNDLSNSIGTMILVTRLYLISLLILLQFVAPLIHAHMDNMTHFNSSLHLPEFEQVNMIFKHAPEFVAPTNHDEAIIAVSAGIKDKQPQVLQIEQIVFVLWLSVFLLTKIQCPQCRFPLKTEPIPDSHFLNLVSPRAPPFFTFR